MSQPIWRYVGNLGDKNPLEYGGIFVFADETGVYPVEIEFYDPDNQERCRIQAERCALTTHGLIHVDLITPRQKLPHPIESYVEWWDKDLQSVADYVGLDLHVLINHLCSDDSMQLAFGYKCLFDYHGPEEMGDDWHKIANNAAAARYKDLKG